MLVRFFSVRHLHIALSHTSTELVIVLVFTLQDVIQHEHCHVRKSLDQEENPAVVQYRRVDKTVWELPNDRALLYYCNPLPLAPKKVKDLQKLASRYISDERARRVIMSLVAKESV